MADTVSASVVGHPCACQRVYVVASCGQGVLREQDHHFGAVVRGREGGSFWHFMALNRDVCREFLVEHRGFLVADGDGLDPNTGVSTIVHRRELSLHHERIGARAQDGVHFQRDCDFGTVVRGRRVLEHQHVRAGSAVIRRNLQFRAGQVLHRQHLSVRDAETGVVCGCPSPFQSVPAGAVSGNFCFHKLHDGHAAVVHSLQHVCGRNG